MSDTAGRQTSVKDFENDSWEYVKIVAEVLPSVIRKVWKKWVFKVFKYLFIIIIWNNIHAWCQPDILVDHFYPAVLTLHCGVEPTTALQPSTDLYILPTHPWQHRTEAHIYVPWII